MADPLVLHDDLILFLTAWYRDALAARPEPVCAEVEVGGAEPADPPFPLKMLVIANDGGASTSLLTGERSVRLVVLAGTRADPKEANDLVQIVHALASQIPAAGFTVLIDEVPHINPVSALLNTTGPFDVTESQERARRYVGLTLAVSGRPL